MSFFRGAALVFLLFSGLAGLMAYQAQEIVAASHDLRKASGRVTHTRESLNISGAKFKVTSHKWRFRLGGLPYTFVYPSGLPNYKRVKRAVTRGQTVDILHRKCRSMGRTPRCDVMQVTQGGARVVSLDDVVGHVSDDFVLWSTVAMVCGLTCIGFFWASLRHRPAMPDPSDYRR